MISLTDYMDRLKGCIIGMALGDAFGAPFEFDTRNDIVKRYGRKVNTFVRNNGPFVKNGEYTDDTQMALCIINAIIQDKKICIETIKNNFLDWYMNNPPDVGLHTSTILHKIMLSGDKWKDTVKREWEMESRYDPDAANASNGSIMRCAPIGIFDYIDIDKLIQDSIDVSRITHYDPRCTYSTVALNYIISQNMRRANNLPPISHLNDLDIIYGIVFPHSPKLAERILQLKRKIIDFSEERRKFDQIASDYYDKGGYVLDTLAIALLPFYCTKSYKDALIETVNFGGDNDTNGAVLGALAGSYYGFDALPKEWVTHLTQLKYLIEICTQFHSAIQK